MVRRHECPACNDGADCEPNLFAMAFQIEIIAIFAAVEQKTWEVAQRLKGKSFWRCVDAYRLFVFIVFSPSQPFLSVSG